MKFLLVISVIFFFNSVFCDSSIRVKPSERNISDFENYLEDLKIIGTEINCTEAEKECYKFDRVLYSDGKCYSLGHIGPCLNGWELYFNLEKSLNGEYVPECAPPHQCKDPHQHFMAFDQTCYDEILVEKEVCDLKNNLSFSKDIFGGGLCRCIAGACSPRPHIEQPANPGLCRLPDLVGKAFPYLNDPLRDRIVPCSNQEHACFQQQRMLHLDGSCYPLLEQGPCEEGALFVANKTTFQEQGKLERACVSASCSQYENTKDRYVRFQNDGKCYKHDDVVNKLCPPHKVVFDVFGEAGCGFEEQEAVGKQLPSILVQKGECTNRIKVN